MLFFENAGAEVNIGLLIAIGLSIGVCSSFFGFGGGFMMTPALNMFGFPMPYAIGTDLSQMAGSATISSLKHHKFGHIDLRLGLIMAAGTVPGVEAGKQIVLHLERVGNVDLVVRYVFIAFLLGLGLFIFREARKSLAGSGAGSGSGPRGLARKLRLLDLPPHVSLPASGIARVSIWVPLGIGLATGVLAGLLGVGGGFIRVPALVYLMGVPTVVAVGTDLLEIIVSSAYGSFTYAAAGRVEILAAVLVLLGASAGVQIGATATRYISGANIRRYLAITILLAGVAVSLKQASALTGLEIIASIGTYFLLGMAGGIALLITSLLLIALRKGRKVRAVPVRGPGPEGVGSQVT